MKLWLKLALSTCILTVALSSTPASALPSRCDWYCEYPNTLHNPCQCPDSELWVTCYEYYYTLLCDSSK